MAPSSCSLRTGVGPLLLGTTTVMGSPSPRAAYAAARPAFPPVASGGQARLHPLDIPTFLRGASPQLGMELPEEQTKWRQPFLAA